MIGELDSDIKTIPPGNFHIGRDETCVLSAYVGTCVAVAMYDRPNKIGGLIHLVLPESPDSKSNQPMTKYAATGLPFFLNLLRKQGAEDAHLKASVAGGALIGRLERQDVDLDLGGRTAITVKQILEAQQIEIEKSETGGFFGAELRLNLKNGESNISPLGRDKPGEAHSWTVPAQEDVRRTIDRLQPIPQVALKIFRMIEEGTFFLKDIADEIGKDQVISARTIQLCNSVSFAPRMKIDSVDRALVFLGQETFAKLVLAACIEEYFSLRSRGYSLVMGGMYRDAIGTALIAENLARHTAKIPPAVAYTAGLLHDIGRIVLDQYVEVEFFRFRQALRQGQDLLALERENLGMDHTQAGELLCRRWALPDTLADAICHHHYPENARQQPELTALVYLADLLMAGFYSGLDIDSINLVNLKDRLATLKLSLSDLEAIIDLTVTELSGSLPHLLYYL